MDLFIDDVANALGYSTQETKSASYYMGIVTAYNASQGYFLVLLDGSCGEGEVTEPVRATAFCDAAVGDRVMCVVQPNGMCIAIGRRTDETNNDVNPIKFERWYKFTRTDGVVFYWQIRVYANNWLEMSFNTEPITYNVSKAWGSLYESSTMFSFTYPITFTQKPNLNVAYTATSYGAMVEVYPTAGLATGMSPRYYLVRGTSTPAIKGYWSGTIKGRFDGNINPQFGSGTVIDWN